MASISPDEALACVVAFLGNLALFAWWQAIKAGWKQKSPRRFRRGLW